MVLSKNNTLSVTIPPRLPRKYVAETFQFKTWQDIEPLINELIDRPINSKDALYHWILDCDELDRIIGEESRLRRIKATQNTADKAASENLNAYTMDVLPKLSPMSHRIHQKLCNSPYLYNLDENKYLIHLRSLQNSLRLYRDENIALASELAVKERRYRSKVGSLSVQFEGEEITLQQASQKLRSEDRNIREQIFHITNQCWLEIRPDLDALYDELCQLRQKIAQNAGFNNYRDYKFTALGRYDYTPQDCYTFHQTIEQCVLPILQQIQLKHQQESNISPYKPWDTLAPLPNKPTLKPFKNTEDLTEKTIACLEKVSPEFANNLRIMRQLGNLDLESRKHKAPGGYNASLPESGVPFIFMNAVGTDQDVKTMVHESGHAMHTFLSRHLELMTFKNLPSEIAELASMSMELMTMEYWNVFYEKEKDLLNAKIHQLEHVLTLLPWVATVDAFQHWVYTHPNHSLSERNQQWQLISERFSTNVVDWSGLENYRTTAWHKQLHIFEVPFYYIEYAIAQLGAIAIWKQYKENPNNALANYTKMLQLGYSKPLPELYKTAGICFDFSEKYVQQLIEFVTQELNELYAQIDKLDK